MTSGCSLVIDLDPLNCQKISAVVKPKSAETPNLAFAAEIEIRKKILLANSELRKIHRSLVVEKEFLEEEEFWSLHRNLVQQEEEKVQQHRGPPNQLLADVRATTVGQTGSIGFKIDSKVTESIFRLFPGVKTKYEEYVPDKVRSHSPFLTGFTLLKMMILFGPPHLFISLLLLFLVFTGGLLGNLLSG